MKQYIPFANSNEMISEYKKRCNDEMVKHLFISEIPIFHKDRKTKFMLCFSVNPDQNDGFPFSQGTKKSISDAVFLLENYTFPDGSPCGKLKE